jgi:lipid-binding SYLF domain-containing protein
MLNRVRAGGTALFLAMALSMLMNPAGAIADSADQIDSRVEASLKQLYASTPSAKVLAKSAKGILVFPNIVKAGFMFGAQYGEGALLEHGDTVGYYSSVAGSYGFQAGVQVFGYAMFFMNENALKYLHQSAGWEIGVGPSIVLVDQGMGKSLTSSTITQDIYAFIFDQKGLMAGAGIQGSKITRIDR